MFVETNMLQMRVIEQLLRVDVDWRLALAFAAQAPFGVDEPPKFWPCKTAQTAFCTGFNDICTPHLLVTAHVTLTCLYCTGEYFRL